MSDDSDGGSDGTLIQFPGADPYAPPPIPSYRDTAPEPAADRPIPPETPEETTMELPRIPPAPRPEDVLASGGVTSAFRSESGETEEEEGEEGEEYGEEGEYEAPRSLSDRIGDWLEYRLELGRGRMEAEAPYREAEIGRKIARIEAHTDRETGLLAHQNKLRQAHLQAHAARVAARGKSDAAGMGADKGLGKQSAASRGGTNSSGRGSGSGGSSGNSGRTGGSSGRNSGGTNSSGSVGRGPGGSSGGRSGGGRGSESAGGPRGRQNSSHGSGGTGSGGGGRSTGSPRAERSRGRQERAMARTAAREQRRGAAQSADLVERGKDRDQGRANRQATTEERRAARRARKEAAAADPNRVTLGEALGREAERRFDKRRQDEKAAKEAKEGGGDPKVDLVKKPRDGAAAAAATGAPAAGGGAGGTGGPKVDLTKESAAAAGTDSGAAAGTPEGAAAETESAVAEAVSGGAETGPGGAEAPAAGDPPEAAAPGPAAETAADPGGEGTGSGGSPSEALGAEAPGGEDADRDLWERMASRLRGDSGPRGRAKSSKGRKKPKSAPEPEPEAEEPVTYTATFPNHPPAPPRSAPPADEDDYPDAEIVEPVPAALPRAPERHTQRPGTTRPTTKESSVKAEARPTYKGDSTPAQHRTNVTFDEFLTEIANIAVAAGADQVEAVELAAALKDVADKLREMASDLVGDHNIATAVTDLIANLADQADAMKAQAERCAQECRDAFEAALLVARSVARVYGEDMAEKEEAGLAQASAAVHHD